MAGGLTVQARWRRFHNRPWRAFDALPGALLGGVAVLVSIAGCSSPGLVSVSDPRLSGTWRLATASDHGIGIPLEGNAITLTIGDASHTGGDSPCSSYSATVTGGVGAIYIRARLKAGPRDDCAPAELNVVEKNYLDALTSSSSATIEEDSLILSSPWSHLVFVRAGPAPVVALLNSNWRLYALPNQGSTDESAPGLNPVYLRFDGERGLTISSSCATFAANYQLDGEHLAVVGQHVVAGDPGNCTPAERALAAEAAVLLEGPLLIDVSSAGDGDPATLVVTNLNENVPVVWRAAN